MKICSKCLKRLIIWITLTTLSIAVGLLLDLVIFITNHFPLYIRIIGFTGILLSHFLLKRSKKLVGRDVHQGKNLYRLKASIKFLPILKNDIIFVGEREYVVENILKNKIVLRNRDDSKIYKDFSYFFNENYTIKNREVL